jgi:hypothetical protein
MNKQPRWLVDQRIVACRSCVDKATCTAQYLMLTDDPPCPRGILKPKADAIAERAWPSGAPEPSDCCGSALQYRQ